MEPPTAVSNPYAPPRAAVRDVFDPRGVTELADRGSRLGATLLDSLIFFGMVYLPIFIPAVFAGAAQSAAGEDAAGGLLVLGSVLMLAGFIVWLWLTLMYMKRNGQSMGKKLVGIKVVRTDGSPASLARLVWLRNVVNGLLSVIPFYGLVDVLFIFGESRQCVHDKIADTIVVVA